MDSVLTKTAQLLFLLAVNFIIVRIFLPMLLSAPDTMLNMLGFGIIIALLCADMFLVYSILRQGEVKE